MRIVFYLRSAPEGIGGVERFTFLLSGELEERGVETVILYDDPRGSLKIQRGKEKKVQELKPFKLPSLFQEAHCLHLQGPALRFLLPALLSSKPIVVTHHGYQAICPQGNYWNRYKNELCPGFFRSKEWKECSCCLRKNHSLLQGLKAFASTGVRSQLLRSPSLTHVVPSRFLAQELAPYTPRLIPHGIVPPSRVAPWEKGEEIILLFAGRLVEEKHPGFALRVFEKLLGKGEKARLLIAGEGPLEPSLREEAQKLGISRSVVFLGSVPPQEMKGLYENCHFVLMPSRCAETFGFTALEALVEKRPVLASPFGALPELVPEGFLLPPFDPQVWAERILELWETPELWMRKVQELSQQYRKQYSLERVVGAYMELYGELVQP